MHFDLNLYVAIAADIVGHAITLGAIWFGASMLCRGSEAIWQRVVAWRRRKQ
jgi:hypothetical protein